MRPCWQVLGVCNFEQAACSLLLQLSLVRNLCTFVLQRIVKCCCRRPRYLRASRCCSQSTLRNLDGSLWLLLVLLMFRLVWL